MVNKTFYLYVFGFLAVALAIAFSSLAWLSPVTFLLILPLVAIWIWKSEGGSLGDLGYRFSSSWFRYLAIGLFFGLGIPVLFQGIQVLSGWLTLTPRGEPVKDFLIYLPTVVIKMIFIAAIEEFVFRGFFPNALMRKMRIQFAIVLSSLLWGVGHLASMVNEGLTLELTIIGMVTFLAEGITLSLGYLKTGNSLWFPYGIHLGANLGFSLLGWFFVSKPNAPQWWIGHPSWSPESGLIGVAVWIILALLLFWLSGNDRINRFLKS